MTLTWRPHKGPQESFHKSPAFEVLYGGAAGGGKTESLAVEALRHVHAPGYSAILFRRTFPELRQARGLLERTRGIYPALGGKFNEQSHMWRFPSGATITLSHLEHEKDKYNHQSAEYAYIGFDELTTFEEDQYLYLFSRARTTAIDPNTNERIPVRVRSASNPGNVGHEWVKNRWRAWLEQDYALSAKPAEIRFFRRDEETDIEVPNMTFEAATQLSPDLRPLSRQFIPATLYDNPTLQSLDPEYEVRLRQMALIDRQRLLDGNWDIVLAGNVFRAEWFNNRIYNKPLGLRWVRFWDLATSVKTHADYTAGVAAAVDDEANLYLAYMQRHKLEWPKSRKIIRDTILSEEDFVRRVGIEKKAHGLSATQEFLADKELMSVSIEAIDVDTDKLSRALTWSARAEQGKVILIEGPWIQTFLLEATLFDGTGAAHDDQIDACSGAMQMLTKKKWALLQFLKL